MSQAGTTNTRTATVRTRHWPAAALVALVGLIAVVWSFGSPASGPRLAETGTVVSIGLIVVAVGLVLSGGILGLIAFRRRRHTPSA